MPGYWGMGLDLKLAAQTAAPSPLERLSEPWQTLALRVAGCADEHEPINLLLDEHDQSGGNNRVVYIDKQSALYVHEWTKPQEKPK